MSSCRRVGCTDPKADNYDERARREDESCSYTAKIHLWLSYSTADSLGLSLPAEVYLRQNKVGSFNQEDLRSKEPSQCVEEKGTLLRVDRFKAENNSLTLQVFDANGKLCVKKTLTNLIGDECRKVKI